MSHIRLGVFFTFGVGLNQWQQQGIINREIKPYLELARKGISITFFTYDESISQELLAALGSIKIVPIYSVCNRPRKGWSRFIKSFFIPFFLRNEFKKINVLKTNQMWGGWVAKSVANWFDLKLFVRCGYEHLQLEWGRGAPWWHLFLLKCLEKAVYQRANAILLTSDDASDFVRSVFPVRSGKIFVRNNYIDTYLFNASDDSEKQKAVLFVGRLNEEKNVKNLVRACAEIGVSLHLAGEGELRNDLENLAQELNADVKFLGRIANQELPKMIAAYEVFVLPSWREGNPKALMEAMSCQAAIVATDVPGINELIEHDVNGLLAQPDANSLAEALNLLLGDPAKQKRLGAAARKTILARASLEGLVNTEYKIMIKLLSGDHIDSFGQESNNLVMVDAVLSVHNGADYLRETLDSLLAQTMPLAKIIVVNDASTDDTAKILDEYKNDHPQFLIVTNESNLGLTKSLNKAIAMSDGAFILRVDADDVCHPERVQHQYLHLLTNTNVGVVGSWAREIDAQGNRRGQMTAPTGRKANQLKWKPPVVFHPSVMIRRRALPASGYSESFAYAQDYDLWLTIGKKWDIDNLRRELLLYRVHGKSITQNHETRDKQKHVAYDIFKKHYPLSEMSFEDYCHVCGLAFDCTPKNVLAAYHLLQKTVSLSNWNLLVLWTRYSLIWLKKKVLK